MSSKKININSSSYNNGIGKYWCTWYAKGRFDEVHGVMLETSGDASEWFYNDFSDQLADTDPDLRNNSIACFDDGGQGHVIFIEKVYSDGSFTFSESNCKNHTSDRSHGRPYPPTGKKHEAKSITAYSNSCVGGAEFLGCIYYDKTPDVGAGY